MDHERSRSKGSGEQEGVMEYKSHTQKQKVDLWGRKKGTTKKRSQAGQWGV